MERIAVIGTGPTGIYTFAALLKSSKQTSFSLFEKGEKVGIGFPYSPETSAKSMLANIASIEIPPILTQYIDWLQDQADERLISYGLDPHDLDERQFTPRLLLGEYFRDQLLGLVDQARDSGGHVDIHESTEVTDITGRDDGLFLKTTAGTVEGPFDSVVLSTGHQFPDADEATRSYFPSPWSGLIQAKVPAVRVGIMGTSLSSIDAAMAVATQHGRFRRKMGALSFEIETKDLQITLMSWTGVLPEADFYCPLPYRPLHILTDDAVAACADQAKPLDAVFELVRAELALEDPTYAQKIKLAGLTVDTFSEAYFSDRETRDPFQWARMNLDEVEYNKAHRITVPWRYALLRMHEKVEKIVPNLLPADRKRFDGGLKTVFVDNYAAVPSESIRRLIALHSAGVLSVLALGDDYDLDRKSDRTVIRAKGASHVFDVFIDARGQQPLKTADLPFPSLRKALLGAGQDIPRVSGTYSLNGVPGYSGRLFLAAIPYLMHDRPFVQGITASAEIGAAIAQGLSADRTCRQRS